MNNISLIGRPTKDIELKYLANTGMAVGNFILAVDKKLSREKKEEFERMNKPTADFIPVTLWGKLAENTANYIRKGDQIGITGRLETGYFTNKHNERVYTFEVNASSVDFLSSNKQNQQNQQSKQNQQYQQPTNQYNG